MTVSAGDIFRVVVGYEMPEEQLAANVIGLLVASGTCTDAQLLAAVATFIGTVYQTVQGAISVNVDLAETRLVKMLWSGTEWITSAVIGSFTPTFTSTDVADMLPHAVSPTATFPTADPKRKGKVKLAGFTELQQDESMLETGAITALVNFATALRAGFAAGSAVVGYAVLGDDGTARPSTGYIIRNVMGSQRSRKPGVGI